MLHSANDGRVVIRRLPSSHSALVGVLEFPSEFVPKEDALYAASLRGGQLVISSEILDDQVPLTSGMGIDAALRSHIWRECATDDALTLRFIEAFPGNNRWTVFGVASRTLASGLVADRVGQVWLDIIQDRVRQIAPLVEEAGIAMGQLLRDNPVWPDSKGSPHSLPGIESRWRQAYLDYGMLQASYGAREITVQELVDAVRADPDVHAVRSMNIDEDYCRYLALLRDAGGLSLIRPRTAEEVRHDEALSRKLVHEMIASDEPLERARPAVRA